MKILDFFRELPKLFDWYFQLSPSKRVQLNYIIVIVFIITLSYYNDKQHRENYTVLSNRNDTINNYRARDFKEHNAKLEFYTDKFNHLLELLLQQEKERKQIKNES
ncbi:hypothetical protein ACNQGP_00730 [Flavobacterium sp. GT2N3]|uniref:hypothetical protein n=1 Tax=unclassified Flavobacterium TaxID=196869 RepID=UPI003AABBCC6